MSAPDRQSLYEEDRMNKPSTTAVPIANGTSGTCLVHGSFVGSACPTCSTGGNIPTQQTIKSG